MGTFEDLTVDGDIIECQHKETKEYYIFRCSEIDTDRYYYDIEVIGQEWFDVSYMDRRFILVRINDVAV